MDKQLDRVTKFVSVIMEAIIRFFKDLKSDELNWLIRYDMHLIDDIRDTIGLWVKAYHELSKHLKQWQELYQKEGIYVELEDLHIPPKPKGDHWPLLVASGRTEDQIIEIIRRSYLVWVEGEHLDGVIDPLKEQQRALDGKPYLIWVKAIREANADPELAGKSANDLVKQQTITVLEYLLLDLFYFRFINPGQHLDVKGRTICGGSRCEDGSTVAIDCYSQAKDKLQSDEKAYVRVRKILAGNKAKSWACRSVV